jgi:hypothetical protein
MDFLHKLFGTARKYDKPKEEPVSMIFDTPSLRLVESKLIQVLISCDDPTASEIAKFLTEIKLYRKLNYCEDIVALLGMVVNDPGYFARQPLTKCPSNMVVVFPADAPEWGENFLRKELVRIRKNFREAQLHPDNPDMFCQVLLQEMDITLNVSAYYRLAIVLVILALLILFGSELKEQFWAYGDNEFLESSLNIVKKQRLDKLKRTEDYINEHYGWHFKDENSNRK